jgi:hypothetical protein
MQLSKSLFLYCSLILWVCVAVSAQQAATSSTTTVVPRLVNFSARAIDDQGKPIAGMAGITFSIYKDQSGGAPLWMETQNVQADTRGNYTAELGTTTSAGLPLDLFASGEARWLGVRVNGGEEQPRVLLLSVPYALKAADAETVGGLPASAFLLAASAAAGRFNNRVESSTGSGITAATSGTGTTDFLSLWTNSSGALGNSVLFQSGSGATAKIGINSTTPASTLDVNGAVTSRGNLTLPATGAATTTAGKNSQPLIFTASSYSSGTGSAVSQNFRWQAEPTRNGTASPSGTLNLLYSAGANTPGETGLKIAMNGQIFFAAGQKFPGAGTVSSVALTAPSSDFTVGGSPVLGSGTLTLNWNTAPTNANTANAIVKRDGTGSFSAGSITATSSSSGGTGVYANAGSSTASNGVIAYGATGVAGYTTVANSIGVFGNAGSSGSSQGVVGYGATGVAGNASTTGGIGVSGNGGSSGTGVYGTTTSGYGVYGMVPSTGTDGVHGETSSENSGVAGLNFNLASGYGVYGSATHGYGVYGTVPSTGYDAVRGETYSEWAGVAGLNYSTGGYGVYGVAQGLEGYAGGFVNSLGGFAGYFQGNVDVVGSLSKSSGSFKIDHPLDPANKYLYHSFVESPDMKNIYDGVATLNGNGEAIVEMPDWFGTLNRDFRYQLTCIGGFAPVYVAEELSDNQFKIGGGRPGMRVSWQITGIRQDPWANAHRIPVEQEKETKLKGFYLHPELYGAPEEKQIEWAQHPAMMKKMRQQAEQMKGKQTPLAESATTGK